MNFSSKIDYSEDINSRYADMEQELDKKLEKIKKEELLFEKQENLKNPSQSNAHTAGCNSLDAARRRNNELIKALEISKARLRSRSTYSPIEIILKRTIQNYKNDYALVPISQNILNK